MAATLPEKPRVSVFTPVYNGASYLAECIESVLRQTYPDFEYVIADNASTDATLAIARDYAARDPRIRVVAYDDHLKLHLQHWNRSLPEVDAEADFLKIVHADDWLYERCLERMLEVAIRNPSVGIVGAYRLDEDRVNLEGVPTSRSVLPGRDVARSFLLGGPLPFLFGSPTSLLFRADLVRKRRPFYNEENIHADNEACLAVLSESDFGFVHEVLTYTRRHNEAMTSYTKRMGTGVPSDVDMYQRWGPFFLSRDEYDRKLVVRLIDYGAFLASRPRSWRDHEFWSYHRDQARLFLRRTTLHQLARGLGLQARRTLSLVRSRLSSTTSRPAG